MLDVTIIGAGPAGSLAALLLARSRANVTLVEQHRFPRDKVCGECLSAVGIDVLDRAGITPLLRSAGAIMLQSATIHNATGDSVTTPLPRPMLGVSRHVLDLALLEAAGNAGATILQPARCEAILPSSVFVGSALADADERHEQSDSAFHLNTHFPRPPRRTLQDADRVRIAIRDLIRNTVETISPSLIILADGKSALPESPPSPSGDIGIKSHWIGLDGPRDAIELFGCAGCYGGLAAIEGNRWNAAFSVPGKRLREHPGNIDALFAELMSENRSLARRLHGATRTSAWLASPLPRFSVRKNWQPGVIPIGNAAAAMEPIGGEGMGLALRSAELAVDAIVSTGESWTQADAVKLRKKYNRLWRVRRFGCRTTAMVVSHPRTLDLALDWMSSSDRVTSLAMRLMGKTGALVSDR